jgi:hypothetical protein
VLMIFIRHFFCGVRLSPTSFLTIWQVARHADETCSNARTTPGRCPSRYPQMPSSGSPSAPSSSLSGAAIRH